MGHWVEIPARRFLEVDGKELRTDFDWYDKDGKEIQFGAVDIYRLYRKNDKKVFRVAEVRDIGFIYRLEEI